MVAASLPYRPSPQILAQLLKQRRDQSGPLLIEDDVAPIVIPDIVDWAETYFYLADTRRPIALAPHQQDILRLFSERFENGRFKWTTLLYSTIKKSGKTTISAVYARWAAETWGPSQEVYNLGNKEKQAKDRAFKKIKESLLWSPESIRKQWEIKDLTLTHKASGSIIEALPVSDTGEAGGNPSLTVWTELWGFQYEAALRFYDEMQPVATRNLSQRFIDTYAGYTGESELLKNLWDLGLAGQRLHPDLPIYGVPTAGLIAYIDTGIAARRMAWQGADYYAQQEALERPVNYRRLHLNEWVESQEAFIEIALWDNLQLDIPNFYPKKVGPIDTRPMVTLAVDASVSGDSTAVVAVMQQLDVVVELSTWVFEPPEGGKLDYEETLLPALEQCFRQYRVAMVTYDEYQLHDFMTQLRKKHRSIEFDPFPQGVKRVQADTGLLNRIRQGKLAHSGNQTLREHLQNADAEKQGGDLADKDFIRIVKRDAKKKIDAVVCLSMAAYKISRSERKKGMTRVAAEGLFDR